MKMKPIHEIVDFANNQEHMYRDSNYLLHPFTFYTETDNETTLVEICDTMDWSRVVMIEKSIGVPFTDQDIFDLIETFENMQVKENFEVYDDDFNELATIHVFRDEHGTELNEIIEIDGEVYHLPINNFAYISDRQLSDYDVRLYINAHYKEIMQELGK